MYKDDKSEKRTRKILDIVIFLLLLLNTNRFVLGTVCID